MVWSLMLDRLRGYTAARGGLQSVTRHCRNKENMENACILKFPGDN